MHILKTLVFAKQIKKLHPNQKRDLDKAVMEIVLNPAIGDQKKGDLSGIQVYKFNMVKQLTLLAYEYQEEEDEKKLLLLSLGSHENFYRDLKK